MVADGLRVAVTDADLVVKGLRGVAPHILQPVGAELGFRGEIGRGRARAHLTGEIAHSDEHHGDNVALGFDKFEVVAGVPPAAGSVDDRAGGSEAAGEAAVFIDVGSEINAGGGVVEMAWGGTKRGGNVAGAVAFVFVEVKTVGQWSGVKVGGKIDDKRGRSGRRRPGYGNGVGASGGDGIEVESVNVGEGAPGTQLGADGGSKDRSSGRVDDFKGGDGFGGGSHEIGALGSRERVAYLIDTHQGGLRRDRASRSEREEGEENRTEEGDGTGK